MKQEFILKLNKVFNKGSDFHSFNILFFSNPRKGFQNLF